MYIFKCILNATNIKIVTCTIALPCKCLYSNSILNISFFSQRIGTFIWRGHGLELQYGPIFKNSEDNGIEISHSVIKKVVELKTEVARNTFLKMLIDEGRSISLKKLNDLFRLCGNHTSEKVCSNSDFFPTDGLCFPF